MSIKTIQEVETYWNEFHADYETRLGHTMGLFNHALIHMLHVRDASHIIELGCGPGNGTLTLIRRLQDDGNLTAKVTACDLSPLMIECARKRLPESVTLLVADNQNLPFEDESFDVVFAGMNINLVPNPEMMLSEAYRILKPGGRLGVSALGPLDRSFALTVFNEAAKELNIPLVSEARTIFHLGEIDVLKPLVKQAGFSKILAWHQPTIYYEDNAADYATTLYTAPTRRDIIKDLDEDKKAELHNKIIEKLEKKLMEDETPIQQDGLLLVATKL